MEVSGHHALAQQIVDFDQSFALQIFAQNEVHIAVCGVGVEVKADGFPFRSGIADEADGLCERFHIAAVVSRYRKRDICIAYIEVPKNVNLVAIIVDGASLGRLELPKIVDAFLWLNGIGTDGIGILVDYAVANNWSQTDSIDKPDLSRADDGVVAKGGKCQSHAAIYQVLAPRIINRVGNGVVVEMAVAIGRPGYSVAVVGVSLL